MFHTELTYFLDSLQNYSQALVTQGSFSSNTVPAFAQGFAQDGNLTVDLAQIFDTGIFLQPPALSADTQYFQDYFSRAINGATLNQFVRGVLSQNFVV